MNALHPWLAAIETQFVPPAGLCACGCSGQPSEGRKYVNRHHRRLPIGMDEYRFWERTSILPNGCMAWQGAKRKGYGRYNNHGHNMTAHIYAYEQSIGPIPEGLDLDHLCRNRSCVNPAHLEPVTRAVNLRRGLGTKLTPANVEEIRRSPASARELADKFGVDRQSIWGIRNGSKWR